MAGSRPFIAGGSGHPHVGPDGQPHPEVTDQGRKDRSGKERDGAADSQCQAAEISTGVNWKQQQQEESSNRKHTQGAKLATEIGARTFLHGASDGLHIGGAVIGRKYFAPEDHGHYEGNQGDNANDCDVRQIDSRQADRRHFHRNWK
jgi:hypothetical protein